MYLGIDIGGSSIKLGILDNTNNIIEIYNFKTELQKGVEYNIKKLFCKIDKFIQRYTNILSIGIGVPGFVSNNGQILIAPNLPKWEEYPLYKELKNKYNLPIAIDNDANAAAVAELTDGAGFKISNFLYITLGTGVGSGIIINNKIYRGPFGGAGELGHIIINSNEQITDINNLYRSGTLESYTGKNQIIKLAKEILNKYPNSILHTIKDFDVKDISDAIYENDQAAIDCFKKISYYLGLGIASAFNLLGMNVAIIGGGISQSHNLLISNIIETVKLRVIPPISPIVDIKLAKFTKDTGIIGAALIGKVKYNENKK